MYIYEIILSCFIRKMILCDLYKRKHFIWILDSWTVKYLTMSCSPRWAAPPAGRWQARVYLNPDAGDEHIRTDPAGHMSRSAAGHPETHICIIMKITHRIEHVWCVCVMWRHLWTEAAGRAVHTGVSFTQQITVFLTHRSTFREHEGLFTVWWHTENSHWNILNIKASTETHSLYQCDQLTLKHFHNV